MLVFIAEEGDSMFLRNVEICLQVHTASTQKTNIDRNFEISRCTFHTFSNYETLRYRIGQVFSLLGVSRCFFDLLIPG
jgi:hypothetical protein